jgi:3-hydroxybutyryl-CoA dehydrogenase
MGMTIHKIGVVGAGQMGAGIAQVAAMAGYTCIVTDNRSDALESAMRSVQKSLSRLAAKGVIKDHNDILHRIQWHADIDRVSNCDVAIEAIVENEHIKTQVFRTLDAVLKEEAIIATNTSSISITRLAQATTRPHKFIGMHFMNPVPLMKLVEIIRGHHTNAETVEIITSVVHRMGKVPTLAADFPGFITNRVLAPMINEAFFALMEGVAKAEDIDTSMKLGCNFPMGPLTLADFIGLDTCLAIMEVMHKGLGEDKYRPCPLLRKYVEAGLLGRKSGQGVFSYKD